MNANKGYEVEIIEGFRKESVDGAMLIGMGIIEGKDGLPRAYIEVDDNKGLITYNLSTSKGDVGNVDKNTGKLQIPLFYDIAKIIKSMQEHGMIVFMDVPNKIWRTEPSLINEKVWLKYEITSTDSKGKSYGNCIELIKYGDENPKKTVSSPKSVSKPAESSGIDEEELMEEWTQLLPKILVKPLNKIGVIMALKALVPDEKHRKELLRVKDTVFENIQITEDGKYYI